MTSINGSIALGIRDHFRPSSVEASFHLSPEKVLLALAPCEQQGMRVVHKLRGIQADIYTGEREGVSRVVIEPPGMQARAQGRRVDLKELEKKLGVNRLPDPRTVYARWTETQSDDRPRIMGAIQILAGLIVAWPGARFIVPDTARDQNMPAVSAPAWDMDIGCLIREGDVRLTVSFATRWMQSDDGNTLSLFRFLDLPLPVRFQIGLLRDEDYLSPSGTDRLEAGIEAVVEKMLEAFPSGLEVNDKGLLFNFQQIPARDNILDVLGALKMDRYGHYPLPRG